MYLSLENSLVVSKGIVFPSSCQKHNGSFLGFSWVPGGVCGGKTHQRLEATLRLKSQEFLPLMQMNIQSPEIHQSYHLVVSIGLYSLMASASGSRSYLWFACQHRFWGAVCPVTSVIFWVHKKSLIFSLFSLFFFCKDGRSSDIQGLCISELNPKSSNFFNIFISFFKGDYFLFENLILL